MSGGEGRAPAATQQLHSLLTAAAAPPQHDSLLDLLRGRVLLHVRQHRLLLQAREALPRRQQLQARQHDGDQARAILQEGRARRQVSATDGALKQPQQPQQQRGGPPSQLRTGAY